MIYSKKVDAASILTKTVNLEEASEAIRQIEKHPEDYMKVNVMV